jgi:adenylyltransferase/sulfurtransferase
MAKSSALPIEVECRAVKAMLEASEDFLLLDCREADEHAKVAIAAATLLPMSELVDRIGELEPHRNRRIVVHCHHGGRSLRVTNWLRQQGFSQAQSMSGGIDRWATEIDPSLPRY